MTNHSRDVGGGGDEADPFGQVQEAQDVEGQRTQRPLDLETITPFRLLTRLLRSQSPGKVDQIFPGRN